MNGTMELFLPSASSISGNGSFRWLLKLFSPVTVIVSVAASNSRPMPSRGSHRFSEAMQSAGVTGPPSCHFSPSRNVNVHVSLSSETV